MDDDTGKLKLTKQKINKKNLPPNPDLIKLIFNKLDEDVDYEKLSDEELNKEKLRLLKQLQEEENGGGENKTQN